jgi:hypothetical protein
LLLGDSGGTPESPKLEDLRVLCGSVVGLPMLFPEYVVLRTSYFVLTVVLPILFSED